jgi:hypothetical protein
MTGDKAWGRLNSGVIGIVSEIARSHAPVAHRDGRIYLIYVNNIGLALT